MGRLGMRLSLWGFGFGIVLARPLVDPNHSVGAQPPIPPPPGGGNPAASQPDTNAEVLTRGPIHEAFAIPVNTGRKTGLVVPRQPPNPDRGNPPGGQTGGGKRGVDPRLF